MGNGTAKPVAAYGRGVGPNVLAPAALVGHPRAVTATLFGPDTDTPEPVPDTVPGEAWAVRQYRGGRALRIGRNRTVHRIAFVEDSRGVEIPQPDCHIGSFGGGRAWWTIYTPTTDPVDCVLCLTGRRQHPLPGAPVPLGGQLALDLGV